MHFLQYHLNGYKWFSSAIDADMALALARVVDEKGDAQKVLLRSSTAYSSSPNSGLPWSVAVLGQNAR
jgi:hypothetical protein